MHVEDGIPCQDAHLYKSLDELNWGIAVVSDGAGSCPLSHIGSGKIVEFTHEVFSNLLITSPWLEEGRLPNEAEWKELAIMGFRQVRDLLEMFSKEEEYKLGDLAATVIVALFSDHGILLAHIGDGRAGYRDNDGNWKSMMSPYHGEEANVTVFITSEIWDEGQTEKFIGFQIVEGAISAFTLMSDGAESGCYLLVQKNEDTGKFEDLNLPYPGFFEPIRATLIGLHSKGSTKEEIDKMWSDFLRNGTDRFAMESDDKTIVLGVRIP